MGTTLIPLRKPFGTLTGALLRHWSATGVWYQFVLNAPEGTHTLACPRIVAAQILRADR